MELHEISTLGFIREFKEVTNGMHPRKFCFVLGAGASVSSGIQSGQKLVDIWDKELKERNVAEYERWKKKLGIDDSNKAEFYSQYYEARFPITRDGYSYMEKIMEKVSPSAGYAALAYILCETDNNIVLTTNFDRLTEEAINRHQRKFPLVIGHEALAHYIADDAKCPIVIKIHRDLLMDPKSRKTEIDQLDTLWEENLEKVFANYHPIFIGYAGNDRSLMDYLIKNSRKIKEGIWKLPYWTLFESSPLSGKAKEFMEAAGGYLIRNCDFDELLIRLGDAMDYRLKSEEDVLAETKEENTCIRKKIDEVLKKVLTPTLPENLTEDSSTKTSAQEEDEEGISETDATKTSEVEAKELTEAVDRIIGKADSTSQRDRRLQAIFAHNRGNYQEAEQILRQLIAEQPDDAEYHSFLGVTLHAMKRYEDAEAEKRRAVELELDNARYHHQLAVTLHVMKRYEDAEAESHRAIEIEPENAEYHFTLGVTLHAMKRYEDAEKEKRCAVKLNPENARYHQQLGVTLHVMERYKEAEAESRRAIELEPENAEFHYVLGVILHTMKQYKDAEVEKRRAVELEPENAEFHFGLGVTLHEMKRYEDAAVEKSRAVKLKPENARYHQQLGVTLHEMKRYKDAEVEKRRAVELEPENAEYRSSLSVTINAMK